MKPTIVIYQIDDPYRFSFEFGNRQLKNEYTKLIVRNVCRYAETMSNAGKTMESNEVNVGDYVAAFIPDKTDEKWIRGYIRELDADSNDGFRFWSCDNDCEFKVEADCLVSLIDCQLATPITARRYIGGLCDSRPMTMDLDTDTLEVTMVPRIDWSATSIDTFKDLVANAEELTFQTKYVEDGRCFGQLFATMQGRSENISQFLIATHEAIETDDFLYELPVGVKNDIDDDLQFCMSIDEIDNALESRTSTSSGFNQSPPASQVGAIDFGVRSSRRPRMVRVQNSRPRNPINVYEFKSDLFAMIGHEEDIRPTRAWSDAYYFPAALKTYLESQMYELTDLKAFGWPYLMRNESLIVIGNTADNESLCLTYMCANLLEQIVEERLNKWHDPLAIIITRKGSTKMLSEKLDDLIRHTSTIPINIVTLEETADVTPMLASTMRKDVLITTALCFTRLLDAQPNLYQLERLQCIWYNETDEIRQLVDREYPIPFYFNKQIILTSEKVCPVVDMVHNGIVKCAPLMMIHKHYAFEAALATDIEFAVEAQRTFADFDAFLAKLDTMTGFIVIFCTTRQNANQLSVKLLQHGILNCVYGNCISRNRLIHDDWTNKVYVQKNGSTRQILLCDDADFRSFPVCMAQHIIHYALPTNVATFLKRFEAIFDTCEHILNRRLGFSGVVDEIRSVGKLITSSYICYDFATYQLSPGIFNYLSARDPSLKQVIDTVKVQLEQSKWSRSMCMRLITKAIDCNIDCTYRHVIANEDNFLPRTGDVQLKLLGLISAHRCAAIITHHRARSSDEWADFCTSNYDFEHFKRTLNSHYEYDEYRIIMPSIEPGQLCGVMMKGEYFRGRVISRDRNDTRFRVLLIDVGKTHVYNGNSLLFLPDEFHTYPAQALEVILMGIQPVNDQYKNAIRKWIKLTNTDGNYCMAHLIGAFERTLLVKDIKCYIAAQAKTIYIVKNLVGYGFVERIPIPPNKIFNVGGEPRNNEELVKQQHSTPIRSVIVEETDESDSLDSLIKHMRSTTIGSYRSYQPKMINPNIQRIIGVEQLVDVAANDNTMRSPQQQKLNLDDILNLSPSAKIDSLPISPIRLNAGDRSGLMSVPSPTDLNLYDLDSTPLIGSSDDDANFP